MSAITSNWVRAEAKAPAPPAVEREKAYPREEEFRSALDSYIAGYATDQLERSAITTGSLGGAARNRNFTIFRLDGLLRSTRRDAAAGHRIVWLAIQETILPALLCLVSILIGLIA
jgi:hypothetical protein